MIDQKKVILMTRMAYYEEHEGKRNVAIGRFFRGDYISWQVIKSLLASTVAFLVGLGLYILYNLETMMQDIYKIDLLLLARNILMAYGIFVVVYCVISYSIFSYRYAKARKSLKNYNRNLKKLSAMYEKKDSAAEGGSAER